MSLATRHRLVRGRGTGSSTAPARRSPPARSACRCATPSNTVGSTKKPPVVGERLLPPVTTRRAVLRAARRCSRARASCCASSTIGAHLRVAASSGSPGAHGSWRARRRARAARRGSRASTISREPALQTCPALEKMPAATARGGGVEVGAVGQDDVRRLAAALEARRA